VESPGASEVFVNGIVALKDGKPTGAHSGRFVRGRAWTGWPGGGCRKSAADWQWARTSNGDRQHSPTAARGAVGA
jgi:hypothetical protein